MIYNRPTNSLIPRAFLVNIYLYSVGFWDLFRKKKYLMKITVTPKWNVCTLRCADSRVRVPLFPGLASTVIQCVSWVFPPSLYQNVNSRNFYIKIHNSLFVPTWRIHTVPRHFTQTQQLLQQDFTEQRYSFVLSLLLFLKQQTP